MTESESFEGGAAAEGELSSTRSRRDTAGQPTTRLTRATGKRRRAAEAEAATDDNDNNGGAPPQPKEEVDGGGDGDGDDDPATATPPAKQPRRGLYGRMSGLVGRAVGLLTPGRPRRPPVAAAAAAAAQPAPSPPPDNASDSSADEDAPAVVDDGGRQGGSVGRLGATTGTAAAGETAGGAAGAGEGAPPSPPSVTDEKRALFSPGFRGGGGVGGVRGVKTRARTRGATATVAAPSLARLASDDRPALTASAFGREGSAEASALPFPSQSSQEGPGAIVAFAQGGALGPNSAGAGYGGSGLANGGRGRGGGGGGGGLANRDGNVEGNGSFNGNFNGNGRGGRGKGKGRAGPGGSSAALGGGGQRENAYYGQEVEEGEEEYDHDGQVGGVGGGGAGGRGSRERTGLWRRRGVASGVRRGRVLPGDRWVPVNKRRNPEPCASVPSIALDEFHGLFSANYCVPSPWPSAADWVFVEVGTL